MSDELLRENIDKVHTTKMGYERIKRNISIENDVDVVEWCKKVILNRDNNTYKNGKNFYIELNDIRITVNSFSYTIITAHKIKNNKNG